MSTHQDDFKQLWEMSVEELCRKATEGSPGSIHFDKVKLILDSKIAQLNLDSAKAQIELTAGMEAAAKQQVRLTRALKWLTCAYVIVTLAYTIFAGLQWKKMDSTLTEMKNQSLDNKTRFETDERAWILVEKVTMPSPFKIGKSFGAEIVILNTGKTPARNGCVLSARLRDAI